jgi:hypothetical protein
VTSLNVPLMRFTPGKVARRPNFDLLPPWQLLFLFFDSIDMLHMKLEML